MNLNVCYKITPTHSTSVTHAFQLGYVKWSYAENMCSLANEIHHHKMQYYVCENEVSKCSFRGDVSEVDFVLWVALDP